MKLTKRCIERDLRRSKQNKPLFTCDQLIRAEYDLIRRRVMQLDFYCANHSDTALVSLSDVLAVLKELRK